MHDSDKNMHYDESCRIITNQKGWRMSRANVFAREGGFYYEVKVLNGIPQDAPIGFQESTPQPHVRVGFARRESPTDIPVGYDAYSYGITDTRFDTVHRSRLGKFIQPKGKKGRPKVQQAAPVEVPLEPLRQGDVIGLLVTLPPLGIHRKVVAGTYNPAVDFSAAPDPDASPPDIIRDHIMTSSRNTLYSEHSEYQPTKAMKQYSDRAPINSFRPHANHEEVALRTLPNSSIKVYKNGVLVGTAFEDLLAFLPPASLVTDDKRIRQGFDDGSLGYYPAIAVFNGGVAETNFGPDFWYPPEDLKLQKDTDVTMGDTESQFPTTEDMLKPRPMADRFYEQIAEDTVWDIIDEASYYVEDGGYHAPSRQ
jgi:COMPASS component BRE2